MTDQASALPVKRKQVATLILAAAVGLGLWAVYEHIAAPLIDTEGATGFALVNRLLTHLLLATPTIFYVSGLLLLARALRGSGTGPSHGLSGARASFLMGAVAQVVLVPTLLRWITMQGGFDLEGDAAVLALAALALSLPYFPVSVSQR